MASDYIPKSDLAFQDWTGNFISVANLNLVTLGLTSADMTPLQTDKSVLDASITDSESKSALAKAATTKKEVVRKATESKARALVKRIQAKADVPADLKRQLQITVPGSTPSAPPQVPLNLVANILSGGTYELSWKRNGNISSAIFIVEALYGTNPEFVQIGAVTKTTFICSGNPPGLKITFRIKAQKGDIFSPYSNHAVVNDIIV